MLSVIDVVGLFEFKVLLFSGAQVDVSDNRGEIPLHEASERGLLQIVKVKDT